MLNNIQIYHIKAEDPMINTSIGKQMHIANEKETGKRLVGLDSPLVFNQVTNVFGSTVKDDP